MVGELYIKLQQFAGKQKKDKASLEKEAGNNACSILKKLIYVLKWPNIAAFIARLSQWQSNLTRIQIETRMSSPLKWTDNLPEGMIN